MKNGKPRVLLLGNGINRAFHSDSWDKLLNSMAEEYGVENADEYLCPETLKAILVTRDRVDEALGRKKDSLGALGTKKPPKQLELLRRLLALDFDCILTANYSYELETAALGEDKICESALKKAQRHTDAASRCEASLMLHTYNSVEYLGKERKIWHIHGEARKPDSMILGHYYYGLLLGKMLSFNKKRGVYYSIARGSGEPPEIKSWTEAFIFGEVYVLGYGFGFAENDMWWLLDRKKRETSEVGKTVFFELNPPNHKNPAKLDLLRLMNVEIIQKTVEDGNWAEVYEQAIGDIESMLS
ncbi:MAG: SIR2 family protein [Lachnospiraceae bacterium]|nr:SIR2 family protein [Ruminococcus sp.]MCM1274833.1 SIR2 family protein [Lachnospiraceae bacterium]